MPNYIVFQQQPENLKSQIYGSDGSKVKAIKVDMDGNLITTPIRSFTEERIEVSVLSSQYMGCEVQDVSLQILYSYFIKNMGSNSAEIKVQISPDCINWVDDSSGILLQPNESRVLIPGKFLKYSRIAYKTASSSGGTELIIIFQAQG